MSDVATDVAAVAAFLDAETRAARVSCPANYGFQGKSVSGFVFLWNGSLAILEHLVRVCCHVFTTDVPGFDVRSNLVEGSGSGFGMVMGCGGLS